MHIGRLDVSGARISDVARLQTVTVAETLLVALLGPGPMAGKLRYNHGPVAIGLSQGQYPVPVARTHGAHRVRTDKGPCSWLIPRKLGMGARELLDTGCVVRNARNLERSLRLTCRPRMYEEMFSDVLRAAD